jgi:hypothetical protein
MQRKDTCTTCPPPCALFRLMICKEATTPARGRGGRAMHKGLEFVSRHREATQVLIVQAPNDHALPRYTIRQSLAPPFSQRVGGELSPLNSVSASA